ADRGQIQQGASNIIINARQAMAAGGHLYISLENAGMPAGAMVGLPAGNYVKITIRDEGTGIEAKHMNRMFEPYFTTRSDGHGLGLATAFSIIHKHGGHISVWSELGKGTAFTLYLPAVNLSQLAEPEPPAVAYSSTDRRANILVMDDEESVRKIIMLVLKSCGFTAATASGGHEAIALYRQALEAGAPFDAVIMDLTIPGGMGGEEAIKNLLAFDPHAKVIVSSGYTDDPVMANFADYGFKGIVAKPYTKKELRDVLARVLQE
ncbi:MAG: ATP-binding protein, partial [bacterium]|nr:ATP-binding protein [bacterium]